jgi:hypothetical protein
MSEMIKVKPATPDTKVRNPDRKMRLLSPDGELVPRSPFWERRLRDHDVVLAGETPTGAPSAPAPAQDPAPDPAAEPAPPAAAKTGK